MRFMSDGRILVAEHDGVNVVRLLGDVRLTLCLSFDNFIESLFSKENLKAVVFDLREAEGIDSTTLGLMAKISVGARAKGLDNPVVVTSSAGIRRLLGSMGFEDIFEIVSDKEFEVIGDPAEALDSLPPDEEAVRAKVIEAHRILMELYQPNRAKFKELVESLEGKC